MVVSRSSDGPPWVLLVFSLPAQRASERVDVWRKLKRYGALPLKGAGYLLPRSPENLERFEWLAAAIRKHKGEASVVQVYSIDNLPATETRKRFIVARSREYEELLEEVKKAARSRKPNPQGLSRLRRRFQEISAVDFFRSPLRERVEAALASIVPSGVPVPSKDRRRARAEYTRRQWLTRPRPGIDRVSSAWLIRRYIDPHARFVFAEDPTSFPEAIPFDMFHGAGFSHRGEDCTFETLRKEFAIKDPKIAALAEIVHDADLQDEKFGRVEGVGLDKVLIGWAQAGVSDDEILTRGMDLIQGIYDGAP